MLNVCIEFANNTVTDGLFMWCDFTGWEIEDFSKVISLIELDLPIQINNYDNDLFICKDANNNSFKMKIGYNYRDNSSNISIIFKEHSTIYEIPNKLSRNQSLEKIFLRESTSNSMQTKVRKKTIIKSFIKDNMMYKICFVSKFNDLFEKIIYNSKNIDKNLLKMDLKLSVMELLPIVVEKMFIQKSDMEKINLSIEIINLENNITYSKVRLQKNIITDVRIHVDTGFLDIYENGKVIFTSKNQNIVININSINAAKENLSVFFDRNVVLKLLEDIRSKKCFRR